MRTISDADDSRLAIAASIAIIQAIEDFANEKEKVVIGLVGGNSVQETYRALSKIDSDAWKKTHFFLLDERVVPLDSEESNFKMIKNILLNPLLERKQISEENIHPVKTDNVEKSIEEYSKLFVETSNKFDIAILSSGPDNHIAAIYPGKKYDSTKEYVYMNDSPKPPKERITATPRVVSESLKAFLFFIGEEKKEALKKFLHNSKSLPIETVQKIMNLTILTDLKIKE